MPKDMFRLQRTKKSVWYQTSLFAELIKNRRVATGKRQSDVADEIGVTRSAYTNWEKGHSTPRVKDVPALCAALEITPNELFGYDK